MGEELSFFPTSYPDEDFRSTVKRYHQRSGNKFEYISRYELFGSTSSTILPRNINNLFKKLPKNFNKEEIIFKNTLLPLVLPFVDIDKKKALIEDICEIKDATHSASAILKRCVAKKLRYCPKCKKRDTQKYGEFYARRIHQIEGFNFCLEHCVGLEHWDNSKVSSSNKEEMKLFKPILEDIKFLLNDEMIRSSIININYYYLCYLYNRGYLNKNGKTITDKIIMALMDTHWKEFLILEIDQKYLSTKNRIWRMVKLKHQNPNPILHIIMMRFLGGSSINFFTQEPPSVFSKIPFGTGPWLCHNFFVRVSKSKL